MAEGGGGGRLARLRDHLVVGGVLALFAGGSGAWCLVAALLERLLPPTRARRIGRAAVQRGFAFYLRTLQAVGALRLEADDLSALARERGLVIAPNHPGLLDAVLVLAAVPELDCVMKADLVERWFLGAGARLAGYLRNEAAVGLAVAAVERLRGGGNLLLFPEGTRTTTPPVGAVRGILPVVAARAAAPVQTILIDTDSGYLGKRWPLWRMPPLPVHFSVRLGRRFEPPQGDPAAFAHDLERYFAEALSGAQLVAALAAEPR